MFRQRKLLENGSLLRETLAGYDALQVNLSSELLSATSSRLFNLAGKNIQFSSSSSSSAASVVPDPGNTLRTAFRVGSLSDRTFNDFVGDSDPEDFYRFRLTTPKDLSLALDGLSANVDVYLIRDANSNRALDPGEIIASSENGGTLAESINLSNLAAGVYYVQVKQSSGDTNYNLSLSTNSLPQLADLSGANFNVMQSSLTPGNSFNVEYEIQNTTSGNAEGFWVDFYLSQDSNITTSDRRLGSQWISSLSGNSSTDTLTNNLNLPGASDAFWSSTGTYYLGMIVDAEGNITEANEANNANQGEFYDFDSFQLAIAPSNSLSARTYSPTDNNAINALLNEADSYWDTSSTGGAITYSFLSSAAANSYYGNESVFELSETVKANVRSVLESLESFINVDFVEVADSATSYGTIRYMFSNGPAYAYAYYPGNYEIAGDVHLSQNYENSAVNSFSSEPGTYGYETLIHETLHALGLKHPGNYDGSGSGDGLFLSPGEDNNTNTIMSYNNVGSNAVTPMAYDIRALQYLYGAKNYNSGNNLYSFNTVYGYSNDSLLSGSSTNQLKQTLWDSGGIDTLDFSDLASLDSGYRFDMRENGMLTTQAAYNSTTYEDRSTGENYTTSRFGTAIAYGATIENLINSTSNDYIIANSAANSFLGYVFGINTGDDIFESTDSLDVLNLSSYNFSNLTSSIINTDLNIQLDSFGSITIKDYFGSSGSMKFAIADSYYTYTSSGTWEVAAAPAIPDTIGSNTGGTAIGSTPAVSSATSTPVSSDILAAALRCSCQTCSATAIALQTLDSSNLSELIAVS